jgi:outer membrane receptor protein involved in Fe transport
LLLLWLSLALADTPGRNLSGQVLDSSGAPVAQALVVVEKGGGRLAETTSGSDGRFSIPGVPEAGDASLRVTAKGFAETTLALAAQEAALRVTLLPARFSETVAVTATRGAERLHGPESVSVLTAGELLTAPAGALDDALRSTPGFSLFRRSSSRVANPTTQGVTLRGVSGSGASRTLVLADGQPLNDPFGSWVYWNRIPQAAIEKVEVVRGAAGDLYGADALGGVVQLLTFAPDRTRLRANIDGASHGTARGSAFASGNLAGWTAAATGEWVGSDGVPVVAKAERGLVDVAAFSEYKTGFMSVGRDTGRWRASLRASGYAEDRGNGTPLQVNTTDWKQLSGEAAGAAGGGAFVVRAAFGRQTYTQTFTAVAADRASERLTAAQRTPTDSSSLGAQWSRPLGRHALLVGAEGRSTESENNETRYTAAGAPLAPLVSGGTERTLALFARANLQLGERVALGLGARADAWDSDPTDAALQEKSVDFLSPRGSLSWKLSSVASLRAAAYRSYRTPTLNELFREFRAGNVVTRPNPLLEPERLTGVEGGVLLSWSRLSLRATGFSNRLDDAVANVTLSSTPALITRQRQNVSRLRASGVEVEADVRPLKKLVLSGLAAFTHSRYGASPQQPELLDKRVPQVPRYQLGLSASYSDPRALTLQAQLRLLGRQYDDDLNQFELRSFTVFDASLSRSLAGVVQLFAAVENLFDEEYDVARTPLRSVGWPRTFRAGLRLFRP